MGVEQHGRRGGADFGYRLRVREAVPAAPDFGLKFATDLVNVPRGGSVKWPLTADRAKPAVPFGGAALPAGGRT